LAFGPDRTPHFWAARYHFFGRLRSLTPGPPRFSSRNSTPAVSQANRILIPVSSRPPNGRRPIAHDPLARGSAPMRLSFDGLQPGPVCQFVIPRDDHWIPSKPAMPFQLIQHAPSLYGSSQHEISRGQARMFRIFGHSVPFSSAPKSQQITHTSWVTPTILSPKADQVQEQ
jgi:hypothetical protein